MGYAMNTIFNIEEVTKIYDLNFGRTLKQFEISTIRKNLSSEPKILTDKEIERFEKNEIKRIFGKNKNSVVYGIGSHIYWNRGREFRKLL
jgi:hypothetical protein